MADPLLSTLKHNYRKLMKQLLMTKQEKLSSWETLISMIPKNSMSIMPKETYLEF